MATVAVLGGGITGLSCAYYLSSLGKSKIKYIFLLEKGSKFGGWIQTTKYPDGAIFEHGPRSMRIAGKPGYNALALAEELGLASRVIPITSQHPASTNRFILVKDQLHALPSEFKNLFGIKPPFPKPLWRYVLNDLRTKKTELPDESVHSFGKRRFGQEIADYILDPLCRGITAGDARDISIRSLIPAMFRFDQQYESVIKGQLKSARLESPISGFLHSDLAVTSKKDLWVMWTLRSGLHEIVEALAYTVENNEIADIHVKAECKKLIFKDNKALVTVDGEDIEVDHIFSCIPSSELATLVCDQHPNLSTTLVSIPAVTVAVANLEYEQHVLKHEAFGFLVPSFEPSNVLGIVFDSCCFPENNGKYKTRITCMMGGKWFKNIFGKLETVTSQSVLNLAVEAARDHLGITDFPVRHHISIHKDCIPQYLVGHYKKLESISNEINQKNLCITLSGASYSGAGVPDCIYNAKLDVEKYLHTLK